MVVRAHILQLVERVRALPPLPAAFVYPCDGESLQLALASAFTDTLAPVLVGPEVRIRDAAAHAGVDIGQLPIEDTDDDARSSVVRAAALARAGRVGALVKGSLGHEALLAPVAAPDSGLRGARRLSHAAFLDLPGWPRSLLLADAALNVAPSVAAKRDIVQNTIDLAHALSIARPGVALLAAGDAVDPTLPSTGDAAALQAMAAEGAFRGAVVEGPLAADSALFGFAAHGRESAVAGLADILIGPGLEAAALVLHTLTGMSGGLSAGIVLGADLPIVAPSPRDTMEARAASCVLAALVAAHISAARSMDSRAAAKSQREAGIGAPARG
jgi:phosphate acetyltransferase